MATAATAATNLWNGSKSGPGQRTLNGRTAVHNGRDFPVNVGTNIIVNRAGEVVKSEYSSTFGNTIVVRYDQISEAGRLAHESNVVIPPIYIRYAHLSNRNVKEGDPVIPGTIIGQSGNTGTSTGPHVHVEVYAPMPGDKNVYYDPYDQIKNIGVRYIDYYNRPLVQSSNRNTRLVAKTVSDSGQGTSSGSVTSSQKAALTAATTTTTTTTGSLPSPNQRPTMLNDPRRLDASAAENQRVVSRDILKSDKSTVVNNVLHNYTNYTYKLALYGLTPTEFNNLVNNPPPKWTPSDASGMIFSGGSAKKANEHFKDDFYFEDLTTTSIIGLNYRSRETNAIEIKFTVFEPNGCTLIDRLLAFAKNKQQDNYLVMPYVISINFLGYDEAGNPTEIKDPAASTKYIPVTLTEMKIKPDLAGTRYHVRAIPYSHLALTNNFGIIPVNVNIQAATVATLFKSTQGGAENFKVNFIDLANTTSSQAEKAAKSAREEITNTVLVPTNESAALDPNLGNRVGDAASASVARGAFKNPISTTSLADALNGWNLYLKQDVVIEYPDVYDFVFKDSKIGDSPIELAELGSAINTPLNNVQETEAALRALKASTLKGISKINGSFQILAGSAVVNILEQVIRHSKFIRDQIRIDLETELDAVPLDQRDKKREDLAKEIEKSALQWFKIQPELQLGKFDRIRNTYSKKITYYISYYKQSNLRYPYAPKGLANHWRKEYYYWYTGKNSDILNIDINFDTAFYTSVSVTPDSLLINAESGNETIEQANAQKRKEILAKSGLPFPVISAPSRTIANVSAVGGPPRDKKTIAVDDLTQSILSRPGGDMVSIRLDIVGDPEFIKQDGILYIDKNPTPSTLPTNSPNGSLLTEHEQVIVKFAFKYPSDWNRKEGLLQPADKTVFDGLYYVIQVDSNFERGQFKQSLHLIRLFENVYTATTAGTTAGTTGQPQINRASLEPR